jgi:hypothetical protein
MKPRFLLAVAGLIGIFAAPAFASLSLTTLSTYNQNFNSLASSGSNVSWTDSSGSESTGTSPTANHIPGWYWQTDGTVSGYLTANPNGGSDNGARYATGSGSDRTMGSFNRADTSHTTDNPNAAWGIVLQNNSGSTISAITVTYDGVQFRRGGAATTNNAGPLDPNQPFDKLQFSYTAAASNVTSMQPSSGAVISGSWAAVTDLNYVQSKFGNTNFTSGLPVSQTLTKTISVTVPNGQYLALRWYDGDNDGTNQSDAGLAIDNLSVSITVAAVPEPGAILFGGLICGLMGLASCGRKVWGQFKATGRVA